MIRTACLVASLAFLGACGAGDGRGSIYSSQRAQSPKPVYIPVTPSAQPVLSQPIAVTPGAVPISTTDINTANTTAPAMSLKPVGRGVVPAAPVLASAQPEPPVVLAAAKGPIYTACRKAGRKAATASRCGCIQAVADRELSASQQRRGAGYFKSPQKLQDVRQSNAGSNEAFWKAWKAFGQSATRSCRST